MAGDHTVAGVAIAPGSTRITGMPQGASSARSVWSTRPPRTRHGIGAQHRPCDPASDRPDHDDPSFRCPHRRQHRLDHAQLSEDVHLACSPASATASAAVTSKRSTRTGSPTSADQCLDRRCTDPGRGSGHQHPTFRHPGILSPV